VFPFEADRSAYGPNDLRITPSYHADQVPRKEQFLNPISEPIRAFFDFRPVPNGVFLDDSSPRRGSKDARSFPRLKEMGELAGGSAISGRQRGDPACM